LYTSREKGQMDVDGGDDGDVGMWQWQMPAN